MTFVYPEISNVFDMDNDFVNVLIIENQNLFSSLLIDLKTQLSGGSGFAVVSERNNILPTEKFLEVIDCFVPFELSKKALISKAEKLLEQYAVRNENYEQTMEMLSQIEQFLMDISFDLKCDFLFDKISLTSLIKSAGIRFNEDYDSLAEKVVDYFELVTELERKKLFVTINLRSYITDIEAQKFLDTVIQHDYNLIMIESSEHTRLNGENRYIVDSSLCEIC